MEESTDRTTRAAWRWLGLLLLVAVLLCTPLGARRAGAGDGSNARADILVFAGSPPDSGFTPLVIPGEAHDLHFTGSVDSGLMESGTIQLTLPTGWGYLGYTRFGGNIGSATVAGPVVTFHLDDTVGLGPSGTWDLRVHATAPPLAQLPETAGDAVFTMSVDASLKDGGGCAFSRTETVHLFYSRVRVEHDAGDTIVPGQLIGVDVTCGALSVGDSVASRLTLPTFLGGDIVAGSVVASSGSPSVSGNVVDFGSDAPRSVAVSYTVKIRDADQVPPQQSDIQISAATLRTIVSIPFAANPNAGNGIHQRTHFNTAPGESIPFDRDGGAGLSMDLRAFDADGNSVDGELSADQVLDVELRLTNNGQKTLKRFQFDNDAPLVVDPRSPGGATLLEGPIPAVKIHKLKLGKGKSLVLRYKLATTTPGLVAVHSRVTAAAKGEAPQTAGRSLRLDIESGDAVEDELVRWILIQAIRSYLVEQWSRFYAALEERGVALRDQLLKYLSPENAQAWFSNPDGFSVSDWDWAQALLTGSSPQMVDARLPDGPYQGFTVEELNDAYNESFKDELGRGMRKYVKRWKDTAGSVKDGLEDTYSEALLASYYMFGNATPQEQTEFVAKMVDIADTNTSTKNTIIETVKRELPRWKENNTYLNEAIKMAVLDATLQSPDLQAQLANEKKWRKNMLKLADKDPVRFQQEWAKRDAEIANLGLPVLLDTVLGGITQRGFSTAGNVVIKGRGSSVVQSGKAAGVLDDTGAVVAGPNTGIPHTSSGVPQGARVSNAARTSEEFLANVDDATLVRSSDVGNIYELPNVGGVPEVTLEAKAGILQQIEAKVLEKTGQQIKLVEALKPSSPFRKPNGVAKLEITEQKTGKPSMLDAGMPADGLGEANVWRNTAHPSTRPGFNALSKPRKAAAIDEWNKANARWAEWESPPPGSKTERLKQMIGQEARVPLDPVPNSAGIQRFVVGEFEEVLVTEGTAQARLLRVKKYEIEVVDTNSGRTINTKTVVDEPNFVPQTPDADAVAVLKEVGTDANGKPILKRLTPAEERIVMPEYSDLNIKARRSGAIPDAAEHGATLLLNDASAQAAGKILPRYGVPFLGEEAGTAFLRRIAPHVKSGGLTDEQMLAKMLKLVNEEGGFGQHLVLVSRDSRYLGALDVAAW